MDICRDESTAGNHFHFLVRCHWYIIPPRQADETQLSNRFRKFSLRLGFLISDVWHNMNTDIHRLWSWIALVVAAAVLFIVSAVLCFSILTEVVARFFWTDFSVAPDWFMPMCFTVSPLVGIAITCLLVLLVKK